MVKIIEGQVSQEVNVEDTGSYVDFEYVFTNKHVLISEAIEPGLGLYTWANIFEPVRIRKQKYSIAKRMRCSP